MYQQSVIFVCDKLLNDISGEASCQNIVLIARISRFNISASGRLSRQIAGYNFCANQAGRYTIAAVPGAKKMYVQPFKIPVKANLSFVPVKVRGHSKSVLTCVSTKVILIF